MKRNVFTLILSDEDLFRDGENSYGQQNKAKSYLVKR